MVHRLLGLALGAHKAAAEPTVPSPRLSSAVPVPRLMIWYRLLPTLFNRHCWLLPPFHCACMQIAPSAVLPQLWATIPLVRLTSRWKPVPRSTNCHCRCCRRSSTA
jgi:hypothetical protein